MAESGVTEQSLKHFLSVTMCLFPTTVCVAPCVWPPPSGCELLLSVPFSVIVLALCSEH